MTSAQPTALRFGCLGRTARTARTACVRRVTASSATSSGASASEASSSSTRKPNTLGWGERRGAIPPDDPLLTDPATFGYCVYSHADWSYAYKSIDLTRGKDDDHRHDLSRCEIVGKIPEALRGGVLYRNGPALFQRGGVEYQHMLDGDGMVLRFAFDDVDDARAEEDVGVTFTSRFVRTEAFLEESSRDKITRRGPFGTAREGGALANALDLRQKNLANTNILAWGGKVYALYEAGRPVGLDPVTLRCLGEDDLDGKLPSGMFVSAGFPRRIENVFGVGGAAFTAHPHVDPCTSRLVAWSWSSLVAEGAVETTFFEWGKDWEEPFTPVSHKLDACEAAPHDFAVTQNHYVLIQNRLKVDPVPYLLGLKGAGECLVSQPELPVVVHVIPRPTRSDAVAEDEGKAKASRKPAVSADGPRASFEIHVAFAHDGKPIPFESSEERSTATATGKEEEEEEEKEEDDDADWVTAYTAGWDELAPGSFLGEWKKSQPWPFPVATSLSPDFNNIPRTVLWRYAVNLKTKACVRTIAPGCEDLCIDHPHVNPLFEGRRECRYVYVSLSNESRTSGPPLGYARVDLKTGETQKWYAGNKTFCEELVIVPKRGGWIGKPSATTSEEGVPENTRASVEEEQECWLLGMLADHETVPGQSCLAILDGADVAAGPVAKIYLKHRVPHGLHGAFVPKSA